MRVPVKLLTFSFWLFFLNYSRCQECLREDIKYENIEIAEKASYADGDTVRVSCMTGYIGLYKLKCEKGEWKTFIGRPCAKKKCSIPGDIANGDFKLTEGTEFAFGAKVVYTCKKGYEMTSRVNHLTCTAQGWDNTLPVCEAVKCPAIHTDGDVTASGNTEKGRYGDVIHFECVSSDKKINGSNDIHCKETGEWSDVVPTCKEITCELQSTTSGVKKIIPEGKTHFRAGESVEIICSEKGWYGTKETRKSFRCQENGEWDHKPVCGEIRCEVPRDQHVYHPDLYFTGDMKLGTRRSYYCESGYHKTAEEATCTQDEWTPKPLCAVPVKCGPPPPVNDGDTTDITKKEYNTGERVEYICFSKYTLDLRPPFSRYLTCQQGEWSRNIKCLKPCTVTVEIMNERGVELAFADQQKLFAPHDDHLTFKCQSGKRSVGVDFRQKCNDGVMTLPECV